MTKDLYGTQQRDYNDEQVSCLRTVVEALGGAEVETSDSDSTRSSFEVQICSGGVYSNSIILKRERY